MELQKKLSLAQSISGVPDAQLQEAFAILNESKEKLRNEVKALNIFKPNVQHTLSSNKTLKQ